MSERSETLKLIISGDGKLLRTELGRSEREIKSFGGRVGKQFASMRNTINSGLKRTLLNPITGLASVAGLTALGAGIVSFDAKLMRTGIQASMTGAELVKLRKDIIDTALATGQSRETMLEGIDAIVERTGDINFANKIKDQMAIASTATGSAMTDMAALSATLNEQMNIDASEIMTALNILTVQGKAGKFTLPKMSTNSERLFSSAGRLGMKGLDDLRKYGALMQVAMRGSGSSEQATTSIERILSSIIEKQDEIKSVGFDVFSNRDLHQFKSIDEILKGIIVSSKGNEKTLGKIFGQEGIRGVSALAKMYRETGGFDIYDKLVTADAGRAGELMRDFDMYSGTAAFKLQRMGEVGKKFADAALTKPISDITVALQKLTDDPDKIERLTAAFKGLGEVASVVAKGLMLSAEGYGKIVALLDQGAEEFGDRKTIDVQWNIIPAAKRKELHDRFNLGSIAGREEYYAAKQQAVQAYKEESFGARKTTRRAATQYNTVKFDGSETLDEQWNIIPAAKKKELRDRFNLGSIAGREKYRAAKQQAVQEYKNENKISLTVNIDPAGNVSTKSDNINTQITVSANRGAHRARQ